MSRYKLPPGNLIEDPQYFDAESVSMIDPVEEELAERELEIIYWDSQVQRAFCPRYFRCSTDDNGSTNIYLPHHCMSGSFEKGLHPEKTMVMVSIFDEVNKQ